MARKSTVQILTTARSFLGYKESDGSYKTLVDAYNSIKPLPQGYKARYTDPWCAIGISAIFYLSGASDMIPCSANCTTMKAEAVKMGILKTDKEKIKSGDLLLYNWNNDALLDHVGIVERVQGNSLVVIECNHNDAVQRRVIHKESTVIDSYIRPDYIDNDESLTVDYAKNYSRSYSARYRVKVNTYLSLRAGSSTAKREIAQMANSEQVVCYGYFDVTEGNIWLYVVRSKTGEKGFCSRKYLEREN